MQCNSNGDSRDYCSDSFIEVQIGLSSFLMITEKLKFEGKHKYFYIESEITPAHFHIYETYEIKNVHG